MKKNIVCIVGTRPEAIKLAPIILALKKQPWVRLTVIATAQHREMLDGVLELFKIRADIDFNIMKIDQQLSQLTADLLSQLDQAFLKLRPDAVLAQGDTTTLLASALACFYRHIPFAHIEAGLRAGNTFPEEINRVLTSHLTTWHFAATKSSKQNLLRENFPSGKIYITGNTIVDSLYLMSKKKLPHKIALDKTKRIVLVTTHRRESFGKPLLDICKSVKKLVNTFSDIQVVFPVHPNPNVNKIVYKQLSSHPRILLCEPVTYGEFVSLMKQSYLIITDSGGIQEEAPALRKPVLVLRNQTERHEGLSAGISKLVGTSEEKIFKEASKILSSSSLYKKITAKAGTLYGDGRAAERIVKILKKELLKHPSKKLGRVGIEPTTR
jgi:UDP-N-acetylglucosamine 2-epimerase (non-hydrolysing)